MSEDRFDEVFLPRGGRYAPNDSLDNDYLQRATSIVALHCTDRKIKSNLLPIDIGIIDNIGLNAVATIRGDRAFIGIYRGIYRYMFSLFHRMLAHKKVLDWIGSPSGETLDDEDQLSVIPIDVVEFDALDASGARLPVDPNRTEYAKALTDIAFDFIVLHELGHLLNGHVALVQERFASKGIDEQSPPAGLDPLLSQTLEMDADSFAIAQLAGHVVTSAHINPMNAAERIFQVMFSIYSSLRVFGFKKNSATYRHPAPTLRRNLIAATIGTWALTSPHASLLAVAGANAIFDSEVAFVHLFGGEIPRAEVMESFESADSKAWRKKILDGWSEVLPDLERLSFRGGLYGSPAK